MKDSAENASRLLVLVGVYSAATLVATQPLASHLASHHVGAPGGDAPIYVWNLWWVKTALLRLHANPFETDLILHPIGVGLALHTLGFLQGVLFIPLSLAFGDVAGANLVVLATFPTSSLAAYALARSLGAGRHGAFLAGVAFGFCPYRMARLAGHYDLLGTEWLPLYALALCRGLGRKDRGLWTVLAGVSAAACGYTSLTYLVFLALVSAAVATPSLLRRNDRPRSLRQVGVAVAVATALLAPLLLSAWQDLSSWRYTAYPGADRYVADALGYLVPGPRQTFLGPRLGLAFDDNVTETTVFTGWLVLGLGLSAAFVRVVRRAQAVWLALGAAALLLSLGSTLHVAGRDTGFPLLFPLIQKIPLLENLRAPCRLSILVVLSLAVLLAASWTRLMEKLGGAPSRVALTLAAAGIMLAESVAVPTPLFAAGAPEVFRRIGKEAGDFTVIEIPGVDQVPGRIMYRQTIHGKPILIGTAARLPVEKRNYFYGIPLIRPLIDLRRGKVSLEEALAAAETGANPEAARFLGIRYFVVETVYAGRGILQYLRSSLPVESVEGDEERTVLRVDEGRLPGVPWTLEAGSDASRMYFEAGWSPPRDEAGRKVRRAAAGRSTLLFRRPSPGPLDLVLVLVGGSEGEAVSVEGRLGGDEVGRHAWRSAVTTVRWRLPPARGSVERLWLRWSGAWAGMVEARFEPVT